MASPPPSAVEHATSQKARKARRAARKAKILTIAGTVNGVIVAGLFNPWDRALYLSVKDHRAFLHVANWRHPYQGFGSAVVQRTIAQGLWFPINDVFKDLVVGDQPGPATALQCFVAGNAAGAVNGFFLNCIAAVKYRGWCEPVPRPFFTVARSMYRDAGSVSPFFRGVFPTITRDVVFGGTFAITKYLLDEVLFVVPAQGDGSKRHPLMGSMTSSMVAGAISTVFSAPFNYARNMQYATEPGLRSHSSWRLVSELFQQAAAEPRPYKFLQERLRVGWGTARVAVGMAVGWEIYERVKALCERTL